MKTTLQSRLIVLLVVFSIIFIAIFTGIQVANQVNRAADFNYYKAKTGALLLQHNLNEALKNIPISEPDPEVREKAMQEVVNLLYTSNILDEATIVSDTGEIIYSTDKHYKLDSKDKQIIKEMFGGAMPSDKIRSAINKKSNTINLYVPFSENLAAKIEYGLGGIQEALSEVYVPMILTAIFVIIANIFLAILLSKILIIPIAILNNVTSEIAAGNLDKRVDITSKDELEELANTFNHMAVELKKMKQIAEDANPLTKLPGNVVIRNEIDKKIKSNEKFLAIYCDLDNFKAFNDKYGIEAGDKAIQLTADVFRDAVSQKGNKNDFVGHEGGDDFMLVTTPDKGEDITNLIISEFDKNIKSLYNKEDIERGYIEAHSRQGDLVKFPLMAISLAGVTNNKRVISSYAQVTNIAAEVKKKAKSTPGSCYVVDKRQNPWP